MKHLALLTISSFLLLSTSAYGYVSSQRLAPAYHVGTYDVQFWSEYFSSEENIGDDFGDTDKLVGDAYYEELANYLEGGHTFNKLPLRAFGATRFTYARADSNGSTDPVGFYDSESATSFNTLTAGAQYFIKTKAILIIPEIFYEHNFDDYENLQEEVISSDATSAVQVGAFVASYIWKFKSEAYVGYRYHTEDLADYLLMSWRLALRLSKWSVAGRLSWATPVSDDADDFYPANLDRQTTLGYSNGGSYRHRAINSQWIEGGIEGAYKFDEKMSFYVGAKHILTGENTANGLTVLAGISAEFGDGQDQGLQEPAFSPELEEYDKSLFE